MSPVAPPVDISVVSVNYKVAPLLKLMVDSVSAAAGQYSTEIVVVDNASNDGSIEVLRALGSRIRLVESPENLGFAAGNNAGIAHARGRLFAFVNPDVVLEPGSLAHLADFLDAHGRAGLVGPKIVLPDGSTQSFAAELPDLWEPFRALPGTDRIRSAFARLRPPAPEEPVRCGLVHGACMVMTRPALEAVRGLPTDTFMYGEELLLGHRLERAGYEVWYDPQVIVRHHEESSAKQQFEPHARALRKRWAHAVARAQILPRPSYWAWNAVLASRELSRSLVAWTRRSGAARAHAELAKLHLDAMALRPDGHRRAGTTDAPGRIRRERSRG